MTYMITILKGFVKLFLSGEKDMELRTRIPQGLQSGDTLIVAQSGTHNRVVMRMKVLSIVKLSPDEMFDKHYKNIQLNYLAYADYTRGRQWVYGICVYNVFEYSKELYTTDFGIKYVPQWFRIVK